MIFSYQQQVKKSILDIKNKKSADNEFVCRGLPNMHRLTKTAIN